MPRNPHLILAQELLEGCERSMTRIIDELALADSTRDRPDLHNRAEQLLTDLAALQEQLDA